MAEGGEWLVPGADVVIAGLKGSAELNGAFGTVELCEVWRDDRIAVRLASKKVVAVRPANLRRDEREACVICLELDVEADASGVGGLLPTGCGCRGSSGRVHRECAFRAAAAQERLGTRGESAQRVRWPSQARSGWRSRASGAGAPRSCRRNTRSTLRLARRSATRWPPPVSSRRPRRWLLGTSTRRRQCTASSTQCTSARASTSVCCSVTWAGPRRPRRTTATCSRCSAG